MKPSPQDLDERFSYHPPSGAPNPAAVGRAHDLIRSRLREVSAEIAVVCPDGRELAVALTKIEEAMFWANAAIARHQAEVR